MTSNVTLLALWPGNHQTAGQDDREMVDRPLTARRLDELGDEELMARVATGDRSAFDVLAARHLGRALRTARRLISNISDAEEIVQEALLRVWINAYRWQPERSRFTTWLYQIVTNLAIDRLRKPTNAPLDEAGDPPDPTPDVAFEMERRERMDVVGRLIEAMPIRQRAVLTLCYYEGLTCREAAEALSLSVSAVEGLLLRSRRALRQKLKTYEV